jgi:hypothetical protein
VTGQTSLVLRCDFTQIIATKVGHLVISSPLHCDGPDLRCDCAAICLHRWLDLIVASDSMGREVPNFLVNERAGLLRAGKLAKVGVDPREAYLGHRNI